MKNWKSGRKNIEVICANCRINFNKTLSEFNRNEALGRKHYCSHKCSIDFKQKIKKKACLECGIEFKPHNEKNLFCSQSCAAKYNNKNRKGEKRNFSDNGKLNIKKAVHRRLLIEDSFDEYEKTPKFCKECGNKIEFAKRNSVFCNMTCKRNYDIKNLTNFQNYRKECKFDFNLSDYPNEFNFSLIEKYGWYKAKNYGNNLNGVSRDHMISISFGFANNIDASIIRHPANCNLMLHNNNIKKWKNCSITLNDLLQKIEIWNNKYNIK